MRIKTLDPYPISFGYNLCDKTLFAFVTTNQNLHLLSRRHRWDVTAIEHT